MPPASCAAMLLLLLGLDPELLAMQRPERAAGHGRAEADRRQHGQDQTDPCALADRAAAHLVVLELAVLVEHEHAEGVQLDLVVELVPCLQRLDGVVGGGLILEIREDHGLAQCSPSCCRGPSLRRFWPALPKVDHRTPVECGRGVHDRSRTPTRFGYVRPSGGTDRFHGERDLRPAGSPVRGSREQLPFARRIEGWLPIASEEPYRSSASQPWWRPSHSPYRRCPRRRLHRRNDPRGRLDPWP